MHRDPRSSCPGWMRRSALVSTLLLLSGCVSGTKLLGTVVLKDGTTLEHVQVITEGQDGPKLVVIETYRYDPAKNASTKDGSYQAAGSSLTADVLRGAASAAIVGRSLIGAAAVIRPDRTNVSQTGGGASVSNSGNSSASASGGSGTSCSGRISASNSGGSGGGGIVTDASGGTIVNTCGN